MPRSLRCTLRPGGPAPPDDLPPLTRREPVMQDFVGRFMTAARSPIWAAFLAVLLIGVGIFLLGDFLLRREVTWGVESQQERDVSRINLLLHDAGFRQMLFVVERGQTMSDGRTAAGLRIGYGASDTDPYNFTADGWLLFDSIVDYAIGKAAPLGNLTLTDGYTKVSKKEI